ncbi:hypothetical protein Tco_0924843 [Tanacetum coccineum]|uniref:Xylulose kinase-1 n=1 Tax=Tanacetum coccineum TaxID=301880 RepID=A0ABQ5DBD1_9ASTR
MSTPKFAETHSLIVFLEKPEESSGLEEIIDFSNAKQIHYALIVNPTIYTSCIEQFWATAKVKTVDGERCIDCLPTATIFEELARMGIYQSTAWDMSHHKKIYVTPSHTKKIFANMKREGKDFSGRTPIISQPSSSKPQKKKSRRKQRKHNAPIEPTNEETLDEAHVSMPSYDPSQSGKDKMKLIELMNLCTQLESRVLTLETTKSTQALEIESLKKRVKSLEKRKKSRTPGFKRIRKGRKISDPDVDAEVTLVDETQEMNDDNLMFDTDVLEEQEKDVAEKEVGTADPVTTAGEVVTTANVEISTVKAPTTTIDELTLAQTLIEIKVAKPKAVTSVAITTTTTGPKARWSKDKSKGIMVEPEVLLKKKDQLALDEEMARNLEA